MATFNKVRGFVEVLGKGGFIFGTDTLKIACTPDNPSSTGSNGVNASTAAGVFATLTNVLAGTNLSGGTPFNVTTTSYTQSAGTAKLILANLTLTATNTFGPFQYIVLYDDTMTTPVTKGLIGWYDYNSPITLATNETFTITWDGTNGVVALA